jgi:hypothetical protein
MLGASDICRVASRIFVTQWSSRRGPLLARAPLRTGHASWPRIRLKREGSPIFMEPAPGGRAQELFQ